MSLISSYFILKQKTLDWVGTFSFLYNRDIHMKTLLSPPNMRLISKMCRTFFVENTIKNKFCSLYVFHKFHIG